MKITQQLKAAVDAFKTTDNSMGEGLADPNGFLKYGNKRALVQDWSKVVMTDKELYSGYPYAAINNRANGVARIAKNSLKTDATKDAMATAKEKQIELKHPYLDVIDKSRTFANNKFWYDISTYLDLEGVYYLFALRTVEGDRVGNVQAFKLLNPYYIRRIINKETLEVGGYVEAREGMIRQFPVAQIIEMRKLNPFSDDDPFAMTDAAKESQFTLKQAGDYTRHSLKNNMAAPGIISTDVLLDPQQFSNFVSRVTNQEKGLPLFGNGAGAITWDSMQIDIDKAALDKINEINRQALFAVSGVGKTMMSIEESGTTRDTARAQKEIFIENHIMPQTELILDALNQDFKVYYETEYEKYKYELIIDNPLGSDRTAELQDIEIRDESYKLYDKLIAQGYKRDLAARYAQGELTLEELGEPTEEPRPNPIIEAAMLKAGDTSQNPTVSPPAEKKPPVEKKKDQKKAEKALESTHDHKHGTVEVVKNEFDEESQGIITQQQGTLQNSVANIEARVTVAVLNNVTKNEFDEQSDIISAREKRDFENELETALAAFYLVIIPLFATSTLNRRAKEFGLTGNFKMNNDIKKYIKTIAGKASNSHINTIVDDLLKATKNVYDEIVNKEVSKLVEVGRKPTDADLKLARKKALEGANQQEIIKAIKNEYAGNIAPNRAKAIARTETNRAFTQSQYQADRQFIKENSLEGSAYKKWITTSANPCAICQQLAAAPPIKFASNFADLGDELVATYEVDGKTKVQKQLVNFEALSAGNAHVNCGCKYMLIIE